MSKKTFQVKELAIKDEYVTTSGDITSVDASLLRKENEIPNIGVMDKDSLEVSN